MRTAPEGDVGMHACEILTANFIDALREYTIFLERGYSEKSVLKLVGDRRRLNAPQRTMLYRGVVARSTALRRRALRRRITAGADLLVDGHNVLYTIANYLFGRVLYLSTDGYLRDAGEIHGRTPDIGVLTEAAVMLVDTLSKKRPRYVEMLLDQPVAYSGELAATIRKLFETGGIVGTVRTEKSPDYRLKRGLRCREDSDSAGRRTLVATSDSGIIDYAERRHTVHVTDLARMVLTNRFSPRFVSLRRPQRFAGLYLLFRLDR